MKKVFEGFIYCVLMAASIIFTVTGIAKALVVMWVSNNYGMVDGIVIGLTSAFLTIGFLERKERMKAQEQNRQIKALSQETAHLYDLYISFRDIGNTEAARQFYEDFDRKRIEMIRVLGGTKEK